MKNEFKAYCSVCENDYIEVLSDEDYPKELEFRIKEEDEIYQAVVLEEEDAIALANKILEYFRRV